MRTHVNAGAFETLLARPGIRAVSFDVFDTALVRTFARPADLFDELGRRLAAQRLISIPPARFSHLRVQAESAVRLRRPEADPDLAEIYAALAGRLDWCQATGDAAIDLEIALERESLRTVPQVQQWIQAARHAGKRIAFVSDMYLRAGVVREFLARAELAEPDDVVLVSCEERATKWQGALFDRLLTRLALSPREVLHVGDQDHSDGDVPRSKGLHTLLVRDTRLNFFEQHLLAYQHDTDRLSGRLAATARLARLARLARAPSSAMPALGEIGAGLVGPWLACFALWVFDRARRAGIKRLYFVSRDGQVMREIALVVQQQWPDAADLECRYLYGSRIAWHQAGMTGISDHQLRWLLSSQPRVNAAILADRLGISRAQLVELVRLTAAAELVHRHAWTAREIATVAGVLRQKSAEIMALPEVAAHRELARHYLQQEGLFEDVPWAVVELGWSGSMMASLHAALDGPAKLTAYYLNLSSLCPDLPASVSLESFAINPDDISGHFGQGLRFAEMIEVLTAADHGTVLGYQEEGKRVGPRLKTDSPLIWPPAALAALRDGAKQFVVQMPPDVMAQLAGQLAQEAPARILAHQLLVVLADFMRDPPRELARAFTACRFTEDPVDHDQREFVRPLSLWPVLRSDWRNEGDLWTEGSLACTPPVVAALARGGPGAAFAQMWRGTLRMITSGAAQLR